MRITGVQGLVRILMKCSKCSAISEPFSYLVRCILGMHAFYHLFFFTVNF